jgi:hypothetical protein
LILVLKGMYVEGISINLTQTIKNCVPFGGLHPGDGHCGNPCSEKSLSFRYEMVSLMIDALSSWDVIAAGRGSILANS